jgi:hypothetical protein
MSAVVARARWDALFLIPCDFLFIFLAQVIATAASVAEGLARFALRAKPTTARGGGEGRDDPFVASHAAGRECVGDDGVSAQPQGDECFDAELASRVLWGWRCFDAWADGVERLFAPLDMRIAVSWFGGFRARTNRFTVITVW